MFRIFSFPFFIALLLALPVAAHAAARDANMPLWQSIVDYEEKHAFENYGPPMRENVSKFTREQKLYEDMVQYFDETAEDEPDFTFIVEAYSVAVDVFRPAVIRPEGQAVKQDEDNPFGEDDPLPEAVKSTSAYVEEVRPTFLPGKPLKIRPADEIKLGNEQLGSLFADTDKLKKETAVLPKTEGAKDQVTEVAGPPLPPDHPPAGVIDQPKKKPVPEGPAPGSDEETLANLKKAVKELGLERQLNFDGSTQAIGSGSEAIPDATPAPGTVGPPLPQVLGPPIPSPPKTALPRAPVKKPAVKKPVPKPPVVKPSVVKPPVAAPPKSKAPAKPPAQVKKKPTPPVKNADEVKKSLKKLSPEELGKIKQQEESGFGIESDMPPSPTGRR